jgi:16S rRNA (adenine1518-N6/adenine1519-N6)-dimethyltransferase
MDLISSEVKKPRLFYPLVRSLFSSRRKTLRNTLSSFASSVIIGSITGSITGKEAAGEILKKAGISGDRRAETLSIDEFAALAAFLEEIALNAR